VRTTHVFAGLPVSDLDAALAWYARLFGRAPDRRPAADEAVWQLAPGGHVYVVCDPSRAGDGRITLAVLDLDAELRRLAGANLHATVEVLGSGVRRASLRDPDGTSIALFESPPAG
jgi:predicted enzyme related to lactoylglutathione lyase